MSKSNDKVRTAIIDAHTADDTRDAIIIKLVTEHDLTLNAATKAYAAVAKDKGWTAAIVSHKEDALAYISDGYDDTLSIKDARELIAYFQTEYGVAESTARDYVKAHCDATGTTYPVVNPREAIFEWFKQAGADADKKEFMEYATETLGRSQSNANEYWKGYELHLYLIAK